MFSHFKRQAKYFLLFSRGERRGIALLSLLLLIIIAANFFFRYYQQPALADWVVQVPQPSELAEFTGTPSTVLRDSVPAKAEVQLRSFDPNIISKEEGLSLGFPERLIKGLIRYRGAGGVFRKKTDLARLRNMSDSLYQVLEAYILLPDSLPARRREMAYQKKTEEPGKVKILELNSCDSAGLVSLKWIGPYSASRIIRFRERLGGYIKKEQLLEVWGINDSFYRLIEPQLTLNPSLIRGIHLNTAAVEELKSHPYIWRYHIAKAIVNYREQHGPYRKPEDLKQVVLVPDSIYVRILPYIMLD